MTRQEPRTTISNNHHQKEQHKCGQDTIEWGQNEELERLYQAARDENELLEFKNYELQFKILELEQKQEKLLKEVGNSKNNEFPSTLIDINQSGCDQVGVKLVADLSNTHEDDATITDQSKRHLSASEVCDNASSIDTDEVS